MPMHGNKQTHDLPMGWHRLPLSSIIAELEAGASVNAEDRKIQDEEIGVLKVSAVTLNRFDPSEHKAVVPNEVSRVSTPVTGGSIIISRANTSALVGASAYVEQDFPRLFLSDKLWKIKLHDENRYSMKWLDLLLKTQRVRSAISKAATGSSAGMKNISKTAFLQIPVCVPPFHEQRKIAAILTTWDRAIELTDKLIAACERRKRGLMQGLLSGRRRFREFQTERTSINGKAPRTWRQVTLGEVTFESRDRNGNRYGEEQLMAVTKAEGMVPMRERVRGKSIDRCKVVHHGAFAYNPMRLNIGSIAQWRGEESAIVSPDYVVFECDPEQADFEFMNHVRQGFAWQKFVEDSGDGSVRVRIYYSHLKEFQFPLPPLAEQREIASVLNACDRELALLRRERAALERQKRGLMQVLLTGRVRVCA